MTLNQENPPFIALPVFPSRFFRHQSMYITKNAGITKAEDLRGKEISIPGYQMTAAVWQRGVLEEDFGVPISSVEFFVGAIEKTPKSLPSNKARISPRYSPTAKSTRSSVPPNHLLFLTSSTVERLFENFKQVEADYYKRTGIFPTIHAVALKRSAYEANPWIAKTLTKAFAQSLDMAYEPLRERAALRYMLPWLEEHVEQTEELMGDSKWWIDGFTENKHVIEGFLDYHFKQGLSKRRFKAEEIFTPNALEAFVV